MITGFPWGFPDELYYSMCARYADRMGYPNQDGVSRQIAGKKVATVIDIPTHLGHLVSQLPDGTRHTVDPLIDDHTLLPYYALSITPTHIRSIRAYMAGNGEAPWTARHVLRSSIGLPSWVRWCPRCVETDRRRCGVAYWHRLHQITGVEMCPVDGHDTFLINSRVPMRHRQNVYAYVSLERALREEGGQQPRDPLDVATRQPFRDPFLRIARDTQWLLMQRDVVYDPQAFHARYTTILFERGVARYMGKLHRGALVDAILEAYPTALLDVLGCPINAAQHGEDWAADVVRCAINGKAHHPLRRLLVMHAFGYSVDRFLCLSTERRPFGTGPWPCHNRGGGHHHVATIDDCTVTYTPHTGRAMGTFRCDCGFVYTRRGPDASPADVYRRGQVLTYGETWDAALRQLWFTKGVGLGDMARRLGVDAKTVKGQASRLGLLRASQKAQEVVVNGGGQRGHGQHAERGAKRAEWRRLIAAHLTAPRTAIATVIAPQMYRWLKYHDGAWLLDHKPAIQRTPGKKRIDWEARDRELVPTVIAAAARLRAAANGNERPHRITRFAIARESRHAIIIKDHLHHLPRTGAVLSTLVETDEQFCVRRIRWKGVDLRRRGVHVSHSEVVRRCKAGPYLGFPSIQWVIDEAIDPPHRAGAETSNVSA